MSSETESAPAVVVPPPNPPRYILLRGLAKLLGWVLYFATYCVGVIAGGIVGALFLPLLGFVYVLAELGSDDPCSGDKHWSGRAIVGIHSFVARFVGKVNAEGWMFCSGLCGAVFYFLALALSCCGPTVPA